MMIIGFTLTILVQTCFTWGAGQCLRLSLISGILIFPGTELVPDRTANMPVTQENRDAIGIGD
eukprot:2077611-Rhodomonas_salina.1